MQYLAKLMFYLLTLLLALQDQPTFRTDVTLVRVDAEVVQDGRIVESLGKESFLVTDAGKPQRILYFGHQDEPLDVVLLFDVSAETRLAIQRVADAAHAVLSGLREGDRLAVMASGHTPENCKARLVADLSGDLGTAERRVTGEIIQQTSESSPCQLLSGIRGAAQQFLGQPRANRRRADRSRYRRPGGWDRTTPGTRYCSQSLEGRRCCARRHRSQRQHDCFAWPSTSWSPLCDRSDRRRYPEQQRRGRRSSRDHPASSPTL